MPEPGTPGSDAGRAEDARRPDLRMPLVGLGAWCGGLLAGAPRIGWAGVLVSVLVLAVCWWRRGRTEQDDPDDGPWRLAAAVVLVGAAVLGVAQLRDVAVTFSPVAAAAEQRVRVQVELTVLSDPRRLRSGFGERYLVRTRTRSLVAGGRASSPRVPVLVVGDEAWHRVRLGQVLRVTGRLRAGADQELWFTPLGPPRLVTSAGTGLRGAEAVRSSLRRASAGLAEPSDALLPALVVGDDSAVGEDVARAFAATGLTHLLAVSGTNLTLLLGCLLGLAGALGVRGRGLALVGCLGVVAFVLVARTEPSVLRAAVMGSVALLGLGSRGHERGPRALGTAVVVLLLVDPGLATSAGFALSVLATTGILLLAPRWRDALARWLPRWLAEAVAVPAAAQLACTPVVAALQGEVSLVAVVANLLAAPAVGPATVLGLAAGLVGLVHPLAGAVVARPAGWCVGWIAEVAERGAALPLPAVPWGTGGLALAGLTLLTVLVAVTAHRVLTRPWVVLVLCAFTGVVVVLPTPVPGWPPAGWRVVACDVGQGDALVLRAGEGAAVVVDVGPDPGLVDRCLDRLGVREVPLVVLTHQHADHVDGLRGVFAGRRVGEVVTTAVDDPPGVLNQLRRTGAEAGVAVNLLGADSFRVGDLEVTRLGPAPGPGTGANDASIVLLVVVDGLRVLLTGDVEPPAQARLAAATRGLQVDVLKVPHHGSRHTDVRWLTGLGARVALVSVGEDNDYGHPDPGLLDQLTAAGARVWRTDTDGDVAVLVREGRVLVDGTG